MGGGGGAGRDGSLSTKNSIPSENIFQNHRQKNDSQRYIKAARSSSGQQRNVTENVIGWKPGLHTGIKGTGNGECVGRHGRLFSYV